MTRQEQMRFHEMQAYWWMHSASNGHCLSRQLYHGFVTIPDEDGKTAKDKPFTDAEKVSDAMETAQRHIELFRELSEAKDCAETKTEGVKGK